MQVHCCSLPLHLHIAFPVPHKHNMWKLKETLSQNEVTVVYLQLSKQGC